MRREYAMDSSGKLRVAVPSWLRTSLGDDFFATAIEAVVVNDVGMKHLRDLPQLKRVSMGVSYVGNTLGESTEAKWNDHLMSIATGAVTDAGLKNLEGLMQIECLEFDASNVKVTDAGLIYLKSLSKLRRLRFCKTAISDDGLEQIAEKLPRLEFLEMHGTMTTPGGIQKFKHALPKCTVEWTETYGM